MIAEYDLKIQVVLSFHECGTNANDYCHIPLPPWILEIGNKNPDIFFRNQRGHVNREYLTFGVDQVPLSLFSFFPIFCLSDRFTDI